MTSIESLWHWVEPAVAKFLVSFLITFGSFVTIGGQQIDLATAAGRAVAVSALLHAVYAAFESATSQTPPQAIPPKPTAPPGA